MGECSLANRSSRTVGNDNSCWVCVKAVLADVGAAWQSEWCSVGAGCQLLHNPDKGTSRTLDTTPAVSYTVLMCVDAGVCGALLCVLLWWMCVGWGGAPMGNSPHSVGSQSLWVRPPLLAYLLLFSASVGENVCRELRESSCLMGTSLVRGHQPKFGLCCVPFIFFWSSMGARGQRRVTQSERSRTSSNAF